MVFVDFFRVVIWSTLEIELGGQISIQHLETFVCCEFFLSIDSAHHMHNIKNKIWKILKSIFNISSQSFLSLYNHLYRAVIIHLHNFVSLSSAAIINPQARHALRLSAQLLLGTVRVYRTKAKIILRKIFISLMNNNI